MSTAGRVLVVEPNPWHYECLPGFIRYFIDLNYDVDLLVRSHDDYGDEFSLAKRLAFRKMNFNGGRWFPALERTLSENKYELLFLNSFDYGKEKLVDIYRDIRRIDNSRLGIIGCYHSLINLRKNRHEELIRQGRVCTLSAMECDGLKPKIVNAHYFSDKSEAHKKNQMTKIISVGMNNTRFECERAVDDVLAHKERLSLDFIGRYDRNQIKKSRIKRGVLHPVCKFLKIEPYCKDAYKGGGSKKARKCIHDFGNVTFETLYGKVSESDFIALNIRATEEFLKDRTSGAKQLCYGFCRPPIVEKEVADVYGFNDSNAVVYENGRLGAALRKAVCMSDEEYRSLCANLKISEKMLYTTSLKNLKNMIENLEAAR